MTKPVRWELQEHVLDTERDEYMRRIVASAPTLGALRRIAKASRFAGELEYVAVHGTLAADVGGVK